MNATTTPAAETAATKVYFGAPPDPKCRASFVHVFVPVAPDEEKPDVKKYQLTILLPTNYDLSAAKAAIITAVKAEWGEPGIELLKAGRLKLPFRKQEEKQHLTGYTEGFFIQLTSKNKPGVVNEDVNPIMDPAELQSGMHVIVTGNAYCWDHPKNGKGVSFGLLNVMKNGDDGTRYSNSAARPEEDFARFKPAGAQGGQVSNPKDIFGF